MRRVVAVLAVAACAGAVGCGDDDGDDGGGGGGSGGSASTEEAEVRGTMKELAQGMADGDAEAVCDLLTESAQEEAANTIPGTSTCEEAHEYVFRVAGPEKRRGVLEQFEEAKYDVEVSGDTAKVTPLKSPEGARLRKVGGRWKIDQNTVTYTPNQ
jgi:hypothetical protein